MVSEARIRASEYHFALDLPRAIADSGDTRPALQHARRGRRGASPAARPVALYRDGTLEGGGIAPLHRLPPPVADPDPPGDGAGDVPRDARDAGQPARSRGGRREPALARGAEEPRRGLRPRQAAV